MAKSDQPMTDDAKVDAAISGIAWTIFAAAAVSSGDGPSNASKVADEMLKEFKRRFKLDTILGKK